MELQARLVGLMTRLGLRQSDSRRQQVYSEIEALARAHRPYLVMVVLSALIAAFGLLANSTAVVIGAMLLAPLMGPILGMALGLASGDMALLRRALVAEASGVLLAVALAWLVGLLPLSLGLGSEIAARTEPTTLDILVGLAAGLAGALGMIEERLNSSLPGVAIAVSLAPPLATCGICLAHGQLGWAGGAFVLFLANFLAIELAAAAVFLLAGMASVRRSDRLDLPTFARRFGLSLVALAVVSGYLTRTLIRLRHDHLLADRLHTSLTDELRSSAGAQLDAVRHDWQAGRLEVVATVLTPREFGPAAVASVEQALRRAVDPRIHLVLRSLLSRDMDSDGPVFTLAAERASQAKAQAQAALLARASDVLTRGLKQVRGSRLTDLTRSDEAGVVAFTAVVEAPEVIQPPTVAALQKELTAKLGLSARLTVRSLSARVTDAGGYLDEPDQRVAPSAAQRALSKRLSECLNRRLRALMTGLVVSEVHAEPADGQLLVQAVVVAPRVCQPAEVAPIEADLRRYVRPDVRLLVRTRVEASAGSSGYERPRQDAGRETHE